MIYRFSLLLTIQLVQAAEGVSCVCDNLYDIILTELGIEIPSDFLTITFGRNIVVQRKQFVQCQQVSWDRRRLYD